MKGSQIPKGVLVVTFSEKETLAVGFYMQPLGILLKEQTEEVFVEN